MSEEMRIQGPLESLREMQKDLKNINKVGIESFHLLH